MIAIKLNVGNSIIQGLSLPSHMLTFGARSRNISMTQVADALENLGNYGKSAIIRYHTL
jgi:hypothetical protein